MADKSQLPYARGILRIYLHIVRHGPAIVVLMFEFYGNIILLSFKKNFFYRIHYTRTTWRNKDGSRIMYYVNILHSPQFKNNYSRYAVARVEIFHINHVIIFLIHYQ